jgi:hypothetical protein
MAARRSRLRGASPQGTLGVMLDQEAMQIIRNRLAAESAKRHHFYHTELQRAVLQLWRGWLVV